MEKIGYVYLTTNLVNGKQYVGQHLATEFDTKYKGSGTYIMRSLNKYGWDNFKCEVICWCSSQTQLNEAEDNYIRLLDTMFPNGYNLRGGGANGKPCKKTRQQISETVKKYYANEENRKKQSEAHIGQVSPNKGKTTSEETCKKISESQKKYYANEENRKKQSEAQDKYKKKVYQYTKEGVFVKEWTSLSEIKRVLGYAKESISACCHGKQKTSYNYLWFYEPLN